jgi:hypothetical protein
MFQQKDAKYAFSLFLQNDELIAAQSAHDNLEC